MKFRKKPIIIEAEQWLLPGNMPGIVVPVYITIGNGIILGEYKNDGIIPKTPTNIGWGMKTLEGWYVVQHGDWIITGIKGEKYPCKSDIFEATYESI